MTNMSYCRFENTYRDLLDCDDHIADADLSETEKKYRDLLVKLCRMIAGHDEEEKFYEVK